MRCATPGAFPAVNPDALDVPAKTSDDSTASTGKARRDDASSDSEKKASEKKASEKKASVIREEGVEEGVEETVDDVKNKNDENAEKTKADVPEEESDPDAQMLQETDAVTVDEMAGERRERHPAAYQVVDAAYEARREKEREEAAIAERRGKVGGLLPGRGRLRAGRVGD